MNITKKLQRLTEGQNKAGLARKAGLKPTQLNDYTSKGFKPRYDIALRIARVLGVSVEWLLDDAMDFPVPKTNAKPLSDVSDRDLMLEVAGRHRRTLIRLLEIVEAAEKINWENIAAGVEPPPPHLRALVLAMRFSSTFFVLYDVESFAAENHSVLPGADLPAEVFAKVLKRAEDVQKRNGFETVFQAMMSQPVDAETLDQVTNRVLRKANFKIDFLSPVPPLPTTDVTPPASTVIPID